jgi:hypothetical protein
VCSSDLWRRSHWFFANIGANVAIGLVLVLGVLLAWQRATRRTA